MIASAGGCIFSPTKFAGIVVYGVDSVATPTMPILTPAASISVDAGMFGHLIRCPDSASRMFAVRIGNFASAARALSAPRGSSSTDCATTAGPSGPKSNSWLPTVAAA